MSSVTVVVVPRERFSLTPQVLETLYCNTAYPFQLIWVDGYSPPRTADYLRSQAASRNFTLIRTEHSLTPNQARNLGLSQVKTPYVAFIDNDVLVKPGWLLTLVSCAQATQASIVGPLQLEQRGEREVIHIAGGEVGIAIANGQRRFVERHRWRGQLPAKVAHSLRREPVKLVEFHCMLVHTCLFEKLGLLDEKLLSAAEHADLCLQTSQAGESIWFEPMAHTVYVPPPVYRPTGQLADLWELSYFLLRWSETWNQSTLDHFCAKWDISRWDPVISSLERWLRNHRLKVAGMYLNS